MSTHLPTAIWIRCNKRSEELAEYIEAAAENGMTPLMNVWRAEFP